MPIDTTAEPSMARNSCLFVVLDCNNFFVSCERVFNPRLAGRPVVVLSNNDACIIARSNEAKQLGITMGVPLHQVEELIERNHVCVHSANFTLYRDLSRRIVYSLRQFCPYIEVYSVDEVFMAFPITHSRAMGALIREMRQTIYRWVGVPTSIGVAQTKTLAKLAAEYGKKEVSTGGCFDLFACSPQIRDRVLANTPVDDVWGIGRQYGNWLTHRGITTALQLRQIDQLWFGKKAGVTGLRTVKELQGISCIPLNLNNPPRKAITCSRSFGRIVTSLGELKEAIATFAAQGGRELRHDGSLARCISVFCGIRSQPGASRTSLSTTVRLSVPTDNDSSLIQAALTGLEQVFRSDLTYFKGGITLTDLSSADTRQSDLFVNTDRDRSHKLNTAIDHLNSRWGYGTIHCAATGTRRTWQSRATLRSPNYTTRWRELPVAHAVSL